MLLRNVQTGRALGLAACLASGVALADYQLVEDFEALAAGPVGGQAGWVAASATSVVGADPIMADNQVLAVTTDSTFLYHPLAISNPTARMFFTRFRFHDQLSYSFGLSYLSSPSQFGDFQLELSMSNASSELRVNNGGTYDVVASLSADTWYNAWVRIDTGTDTFQVWLHDRDGEAAQAFDQLSVGGVSDFAFRGSPSSSDLRSFFVKTGGGASSNAGPLYLDNLYLESGNALNLQHPVPVPEPAVVAYLIIGLGMLGLLRRRMS